ncbi:hypothetical protein [Dyella sp.]|uniref:hypothetical protein n=1 Tax=Dyella sp. TaxID=1869338 RepID=UPI002ED2E329
MADADDTARASSKLPIELTSLSDEQSRPPSTLEDVMRGSLALVRTLSYCVAARHPSPNRPLPANWYEAHGLVEGLAAALEILDERAGALRQQMIRSQAT